MTRQASLVRARKSPKKLGMSSSNIRLPSLRVLGKQQNQTSSGVERMYQVYDLTLWNSG